MRSTTSRFESPEKRDARIARLINSVRGPRTAAEIAECDEWLAERVAVVRKAHQLYPLQVFAEAEDTEDDEVAHIVEKRREYVRSNLGTAGWWKGRRVMEKHRHRIVSMRDAGKSYAEIAATLKLGVDAVRRSYLRDVVGARAAT